MGFVNQKLRVYWTRRCSVQMGDGRTWDALPQGESLSTLTGIIGDEPAHEVGHSG